MHHNFLGLVHQQIQNFRWHPEPWCASLDNLTGEKAAYTSLPKDPYKAWLHHRPSQRFSRIRALLYRLSPTVPPKPRHATELQQTAIKYLDLEGRYKFKDELKEKLRNAWVFNVGLEDDQPQSRTQSPEHSTSAEDYDLNNWDF
ncbi:hypothetical protein BGX26_000822 [Mortierella sp. AD094]|nr:hypothetical protein BGX26_000822 [Mortierella sp. AD094]